MDSKVNFRVEQSLVDAFSAHCKAIGSSVSVELRRYMALTTRGAVPAASGMSRHQRASAKPAKPVSVSREVSRQVRRQLERETAKKAKKAR